MSKQTVYYTEALRPVVAGERAAVVAYEHYRLGTVPRAGWLNTSPVVAVGEDGTTFETMNSIYVLRDKVEADEPLLADEDSVPASKRLSLSTEVAYHPV